MYIVIPLLKKYEILPNAYTRLIGGKVYLFFLLEKLKGICGEGTEFCIFTDLAEIDVITSGRQDCAIDIVYEEKGLDSKLPLDFFLQEVNELKFCKPFIVYNPQALMFDDSMIRKCILESSQARDNSVLYCCGRMPGLLFEDFMNECVMGLIFNPLYITDKNYLPNSIKPNSFSNLINSVDQWILADRRFKKKRIVFRTNGYKQLGMGHIYNCITMAYALYEHEIIIVINRVSEEGIRKLTDSRLAFKIIEGDNEIEEIDEIIEEYKPDIWVNDYLNTSAEYVKRLKSKVDRVVTIEDLGDGTRYADAVINALYDDSILSGNNIYNGWKYVCLRDEFQQEERRKFHEKVNSVLIMFGGTDPSGYNKKMYPIIEKIASKYSDIVFQFIVGIGYDAEANGVITNASKNIFVHTNVQRVSAYMKEADLAITSQGRAIFELASMGVPAIVLSQNMRETSHNFAKMENGYINLGPGWEISSEVLENTLYWLINTPVVRKNMYDLMKNYPLRKGIVRVKNLILGETDFERGD